MEKLRSICIIYERNDSFEAYYIKEFFKLAGFSVGEYKYGSKYNIFKVENNCNFDIIVNLNGAMPASEVEALKENNELLIYSKNILKDEPNSENKLLDELINDITKDVNAGGGLHCF